MKPAQPLSKPKNICVFCSSSSAVDEVYHGAARELGRELVSRDYGLVYGGAGVGLMGTLAASVKQSGGRVIGVLPHSLREKEIAYRQCDELLFTADLRERKALMVERAQGVIALPGGIGTLEELLEVLTLRQLGLAHLPVVLLNIQDFYRPLLDLFDRLIEQRFMKESFHQAYYSASTPKEALDRIESHAAPEPLEAKWF